MKRRLARLGLAATALLLAAALLAALFGRWTVYDPALRERVVRAAAEASGFQVQASGPVVLRLLPRPSVELHDVSVSGLSGALAVAADAARGRLALWPLLRADLQVVATSFDEATVVVDGDRLQQILPSQALVATSLARLQLSSLALRNAVLRFRSADPQRDMLITDVTATLAWPGPGADISLAGWAQWHGIAASYALDLDDPAAVLAGGQSLGSARIKGELLDADVRGTLFGAGDTRFTGDVAASSPMLGDLLRAFDRPRPQVAGLRQARLTGAATLTADTLALDNATLTLDDMAFDGALALHQHDARIALVGTLATDRMVLDPFLRAFPPLASAGAWSTKPLKTASIADDEIDLRISASSAQWGEIAVEDASLSLQSGDGRLELSLGEARAYDGLVKGRIVATLDGGSTDVRLEATASRLDLGALLREVPGAPQLGGTGTAHLSLEGRGATPADLIGSLQGDGQAAVHDGALGGHALTMLRRAVPLASSLPRDQAPFDTATAVFKAGSGVLTVQEGTVTWPDGRAGVTGTVSLPAARLDLTAEVAPIGEDQPPAVYNVRGSWQHPAFGPPRPPS